MEESSQISIFPINTTNDIFESKKYLNDTVGVYFNSNFFAFSSDSINFFIFPLRDFQQYIIDIFRNKNITKIISRPLALLKSVIGSDSCLSCQHIGDLLTKKTGNRFLVAQMKQDLLDQSELTDDFQKAVSIISIILKYKHISDVTIKPPKKVPKNIFNTKRESLLIYSTIFTSILIDRGPTKFTNLISIFRKMYSNLYETKLSPSYALSELIRFGLFKNNKDSTFISLPDFYK